MLKLLLILAICMIFHRPIGRVFRFIVSFMLLKAVCFILFIGIVGWSIATYIF